MVQSYNPSHKFSLETVRRNLWEDEAQRRKERLIWGKGQVKFFSWHEYRDMLFDSKFIRIVWNRLKSIIFFLTNIFYLIILSVGGEVESRSIVIIHSWELLPVFWWSWVFWPSVPGLRWLGKKKRQNTETESMSIGSTGSKEMLRGLTNVKLQLSERRSQFSSMRTASGWSSTLTLRSRKLKLKEEKQAAN